MALVIGLGGCVLPPEMRREVLNPGDVPVVLTSRPTLNRTPVTAQLVCYGEKLKQAGTGHISIAVGNIRDYTGRQNDSEGYLVTQGAALMAYTALGHLVPGIALHERFDTRVADAELKYLSNRQLGDGAEHETVDPKTGESATVKWKPYYGGSVLQTDYYIVGGITELNFNIQSGGGEIAVDSVGAKGRIYTMNVVVDLRIVGSQTLKVYDTVSVQKQISGYEVGANIFRFFDSRLWDVNVGAKNQEPLQLAVRMAVETAILDLLPSVTHVKPDGCDPAVPLVEEDQYATSGKL